MPAQLLTSRNSVFESLGWNQMIEVDRLLPGTLAFAWMIFS